MSDFDDFLKEQLKSEEFRREWEALTPDYEFVLRGDVDPRNLAHPIKMDGTEFNDYERGYNDGVIDAYWLTRNAKAVEAEPVVHAHWEDEYGGKYANPRYRCSACKAKSLWKSVQDELLSWHEVQALTERCPHCGAHMDEEVADD